MSEKLTFRIHKVRCTDETGGKFQEKFGKDDIFLAAVAIGADKSVKIIPAFHVGQFDDKTEKRFSPPRPLVEFDLSNGRSFPKPYMVKLVLIERDSGKNIKPFLDNLAKETKVVMKKADALAGGQEEESSEWLKTLIEIGKAITTELVKEARKDDIFPPDDAFIVIPKANFLWPGGDNHSPNEFSKFQAANGKYSVKYDWQITR